MYNILDDIIIPSHVRYDKDLRPASKLLYGEITREIMLKGECTLTNKDICERYGVIRQTVDVWTKQLQDKELILVYETMEGRKIALIDKENKSLVDNE